MVPLSAVSFSCSIWLIVTAKYASEEGEYGMTIRALVALSHRLLSTYLVPFICASLIYFVTCSFPPYFSVFAPRSGAGLGPHEASHILSDIATHEI